jgi:hypothetical protein
MQPCQAEALAEQSYCSQLGAWQKPCRVDRLVSLPAFTGLLIVAMCCTVKLCGAVGRAASAPGGWPAAACGLGCCCCGAVAGAGIGAAAGACTHSRKERHGCSAVHHVAQPDAANTPEAAPHHCATLKCRIHTQVTLRGSTSQR